MQILTNTGGVASTNCFLIADEASGRAVLFDAPDGTVGPLMEEAKRRGYDVIGLWLTHGHFDHIADHAVVTAAYPKARVLLHALDVPKLKNPGVMTRMFGLPLVIPPREPDELVEDGRRLEIGGLKVEVIHTPGHAPGHVCYHFPEERVLVGGDLIICGAVGRTDFPDSDEGRLRDSVRRVMALPDDTRLLPGHCELSSVGAERAGNAYVRAVMAGRGF
jgi:glyoxylase-like metal-dependent hydrolase (beta-lactamase superfamily II)